MHHGMDDGRIDFITLQFDEVDDTVVIGPCYALSVERDRCKFGVFVCHRYYESWLVHWYVTIRSTRGSLQLSL